MIQAVELWWVSDVQRIKIKMRELLQKFETRRPEVVFEWKDPETEAEGWVVINSLRGGAAGGGTRMRKGLDKREVESLAKTMEVKFTVSGPPIGGAKSGINFDPGDPRLGRNISASYHRNPGQCPHTGSDGKPVTGDC